VLSSFRGFFASNPITRLPRYSIARFLFPALSLVLLISACAEPAKPARERSDAPVWRQLGMWSGRSNSQTGSFTVETGALRLRWEARNESPPGSGRLRVTLHSAISGRALQVIVDHRGSGTDTVSLQDDPRVSYLVVESQNVDWTLTLEEASRPGS
jgi:outer membrane biogenesis lipoprotein LolB